MSREPWVNVEIAPGEAPSVTRCEPTDAPAYVELYWERVGLTVMLAPADVQELVSRALVAGSEPVTIGA